MTAEPRGSQAPVAWPHDPAAGPGDAPLHVELVWATGPHAVHRVPLTLPPGSTVRDAVLASGLPFVDHLPQGAACGIWGRACTPDAVLRDRDRVELYRNLQVDPKEARRLRVKPEGRRPGRGSGKPPAAG